jgi:hypothetical protein
MEKEFIPYEQALALKELGFDEPCFGRYDSLKVLVTISRPKSNSYYKGSVPSFLATPLYQQVFRWFREKYNLKGHVEAIEYFDETPDTYHWSILNEYNSGNDQLTYEEAELECLKKLIEISIL